MKPIRKKSYCTQNDGICLDCPLNKNGIDCSGNIIGTDTRGTPDYIVGNHFEGYPIISRKDADGTIWDLGCSLTDENEVMNCTRRRPCREGEIPTIISDFMGPYVVEPADSLDLVMFRQVYCKVRDLKPEV